MFFTLKLYFIGLNSKPCYHTEQIYLLFQDSTSTLMDNSHYAKLTISIYFYHSL